MNDDIKFKLPPSATPMKASELNAIRFNGRHTLLTPEKLSKMAAADESETVEG